jgi:Zn-dependent protease
MGHSIRLGKLFNISIYLHYSWFIIFALLTFSLSLSYFPTDYPLWSRVAGGVAASLLLFASVIAHELAHSLVAIRNGIPVKSITLFIFGGVAQITREATRPMAELVMAAAGPLCSLTLAGIFAGITFLFSNSGGTLICDLVGLLAYINAMLGLFNLIPGFPLDGGRILRALLWRGTGNYRRATYIASWSGRGVAYMLIFGGIALVFGYTLGRATLVVAMFGSTIYLGAFDGFWLVLIGWFLHYAATTSYRQAEWYEDLRGLTARDVMTCDWPTIPPNLSLKELVQSYILPTGRSYFLVAEEERLRGIIALYAIKLVPQLHWDLVRVDEIMTPLSELVAVQPDDDALSILERMAKHNVSQAPVVKEGRILGMVARDNLIRFIQLRSELKASL